MSKPYEITDKDIVGIIRFLKLYDPENATREMAIAFIEKMQDRTHVLSHTNHDLLVKIYDELQVKKQSGQ